MISRRLFMGAGAIIAAAPAFSRTKDGLLLPEGVVVGKPAMYFEAVPINLHICASVDQPNTAMLEFHLTSEITHTAGSLFQHGVHRRVKVTVTSTGDDQ